MRVAAVKVFFVLVLAFVLGGTVGMAQTAATVVKLVKEANIKTGSDFQRMYDSWVKSHYGDPAITNLMQAYASFIIEANRLRNASTGGSVREVESQLTQMDPFSLARSEFMRGVLPASGKQIIGSIQTELRESYPRIGFYKNQWDAYGAPPTRKMRGYDPDADAVVQSIYGMDPSGDSIPIQLYQLHPGGSQ